MLTRIYRRDTAYMWRWLVVIAFTANMAFNYFAAQMLNGISIAEISAQYNSLFTPAGYAFSIWGVIYISMLTYGVYQLLPGQRDELLYDRLARPLVLYNLLSIVWIIGFRLDFQWLSIVVISIMLVVSLNMYGWVRDAILRDEFSQWLTVPFSLLAGWISVATIANAATFILSTGVEISAGIQMIITMVMIVVAALIGTLVCFRCRDYIFPAVIMWACVAIFVARQELYPYLGFVALLGASIPVIWIATTLVKRITYRHRVLANKLSF